MSIHAHIAADAVVEAPAHFDEGQLKRIIEAANKERIQRKVLADKLNMPYSGIAMREVVRLAIECLDELDGEEGFEMAHEELQTYLEEIDFYPLWVATAQVAA